MFNPSPLQISQALGSPLANVQAHWPSLHEQLVKYGTHYDSGFVAALATVGVECRTFAPINEYGGPKYFFKMYDIDSPDPERRKVARSLGNIHPGDGVKFHGRGYIQTTGRGNYAILTPIIGIDMEANPDALLDPLNAAIAFGHYWKSHGCDVWAQKAMTAKPAGCRFCKQRRPTAEEECCSECAWKMVRRKVNGGLNGWPEFIKNRDHLLKFVA